MGFTSSSKTTKPSNLRKGAWSKEEDELLRKCIDKYGEGKWSSVPDRAGLKRCRKSCRLRWLNYLSPAIHRGKFNGDEVDLIVRLHKLVGNRWSLIAGRIPSRTANDIKNFWNSHLSKKKSDDARGENRETENVGTMIVRPQPQRVCKSWTWSGDENGSRRQEPIGHAASLPPEAIDDRGKEGEWLSDHPIPPHDTHGENIARSLDLHFDYETEEMMMDEAMFMEGIKEWEKLLQGTICLD